MSVIPRRIDQMASNLLSRTKFGIKIRLVEVSSVANEKKN